MVPALYTEYIYSILSTHRHMLKHILEKFQGQELFVSKIMPMLDFIHLLGKQKTGPHWDPF